MACPDNTTIQYTITFNSDPSAGHVKTHGQFTFCLVIDGNDITGTVDELGVTLSGQKMDLNFGVERIVLTFAWSPSRVTIRGFTSPDAGGRRELIGRWIASALPAESIEGDDRQQAAAALPPPVGPDVGETGTGTGQST